MSNSLISILEGSSASFSFPHLVISSWSKLNCFNLGLLTTGVTSTGFILSIGDDVTLTGDDSPFPKISVETAKFSKEKDLIYAVSGLVKVSIVKEDGIYEDLYSYTTKITVNKDDEIENCENVYINKLL